LPIGTTEGHPQAHSIHFTNKPKRHDLAHKLQLQFKDPKPGKKDMAPRHVSMLPQSL